MMILMALFLRYEIYMIIISFICIDFVRVRIHTTDNQCYYYDVLIPLFIYFYIILVSFERDILCICFRYLSYFSCN